MTTVRPLTQSAIGFFVSATEVYNRQLAALLVNVKVIPMASRVPWTHFLLQEVTKADEKDILSGKLMQLATVKLDGKPSNRSVVFRGFLGSDSLLFYGDYRYVTNMRCSKYRSISITLEHACRWQA